MIKLTREESLSVLDWLWFKTKHYEKHPPVEQHAWLSADIELHNKIITALEEEQKKKN